MTKLSGWKRLFLVFAVFSAIASFIGAFEQVRQMRIQMSYQQESVRKLLNIDSSTLPCKPNPNGIGCTQELSDHSKIFIDGLRKSEAELKYALPKLFFSYFFARSCSH